MSWIRDLFGIRKDLVDTKKAQLEVKKLEDAEREKLITLATMDDVKKYDPNTRKIFAKILGRYKRRDDDYYHDDILLANRAALRRLGRHQRRGVIILVLLITALLIIGGLVYFLYW